MRLVKASFEIIPQNSGIKGVYKQIELAGRVCYKSESNITEDSAKGFVDRMIKSEHCAMLEHGTVYLKIQSDIVNEGNCNLDLFTDGNPYSRWYIKDGYWYVTTNFRVLIEQHEIDLLQYLCEPTEYHEKRATVKFICDRGIWNEFIRHRVFQKIDEDDFISFGSIGENFDKFSFAQESTRYCNYSKDKFGNELTFIIPSWIDNKDEIIIDNLHISEELEELHEYFGEKYGNFLYALRGCEKSYFTLLDQGWTAQQARSVLPNSLKTEIVMTGFVSDWKHFFKLRCDKSAHPDARELAIPLKDKFKELELI